MATYCNSDIFKVIQDENDRAIGVDTYHHLTIAGVAFKGISASIFFLLKLLVLYLTLTTALSRKSYGWNVISISVVISFTMLETEVNNILFL